MERGALPVDEVPGGVDVQSTVESAQTFLWDREDARAYADTGLHGGTGTYVTVHDGDVIRITQRDGRIDWEATTDAVPVIRDRLRLGDDLDAIVDAIPADPLVRRALDAYPGMRVASDPFFPCLVSFICSTRMRVERIASMVAALKREYGPAVGFDGETYHGFPSAGRLAAATEAELRGLGLGYRAPYVVETARMIDRGDRRPGSIPADYEAARETLTAYAGVGEKVADCVCLFSLGHLEAVPLDTWIRSAVESHYPECDRGTYAETSRALRSRFGPYAGYAQTYVFHHLRHLD